MTHPRRIRGTTASAAVVALLTVGGILGSHPALAACVGQGFLCADLTSIDARTRKVDIDVRESTNTGVSTMGPPPPDPADFHPRIQWGDGVTSSPAYTTLFLGSFLALSTSHTYPDISPRQITVTGGYLAFFPVMTTVHFPVAVGCAATPVAPCDASAAKASLQIQKSTADDAKKKLVFKWSKGTVASFDDPTDVSQYFLCVYAPTLVLQAVVPSGPPWSPRKSGFKYAEKTGAAGGVTGVKLQAGTLTGKIQFKGKGANLDDPLPLTQPVLVQVQNTLGQCWEHQFTSPEKESTDAKFKDQEP